MPDLPGQQLLFANTSGAIFSPCRRYRYRLTRVACHGDGVCCWVLLNPSTADEIKDDPTIRRVISYTKEWGYADAVVLNLFAIRATDPKVMLAAADPVGPENDRYIREAVRASQGVVCAWGAHGGHRDRDKEVLTIIREEGQEPGCLAVTKDGYPGHPLYLERTLWAKAYGGRP